MDNELIEFLQEMKERMPIDRFNLPVECSQQAVLNDLVGDKVVDAKDVMNGAKDQLRLTEAKLMDAIRSNPSKFGLDKVTETVVGSAIVRQDSYIKALADLREAEKIYGRLAVIQESVAQRKSQLGNLTEQFVHDFYNQVDKQVNEQNGHKAQRAMDSATEEEIIAHRLQRKREREQESETEE